MKLGRTGNRMFTSLKMAARLANLSEHYLRKKEIQFTGFDMPGSIPVADNDCYVWQKSGDSSILVRAG